MHERERCLFQSSVNSSLVLMTLIFAYLAKAACQLIIHTARALLREIRRWEELVPVLFFPSTLSPSSSSASRSADVVGPLRAHLLCCRSFGPASVWLGARWLGYRPRQSTQVSHGYITHGSAIKEKQETARGVWGCKATVWAKTIRGFTRTRIYNPRTWKPLRCNISTFFNCKLREQCVLLCLPWNKMY